MCEIKNESESKFEVKFELKQHTPIIHFQSEQAGATLRATELKPKIDYFITKRLEKVDQKLYEKYKPIINDCNIFPESKGSNKYSIKIINNSKNKNLEEPKSYVKTDERSINTIYEAPYFSDGKSVFYKESIILSIKSFNSNLLDLIKSVIDYVLVFENFGTRQSKGFGAFSKKDISKEKLEEILKKHENPVYILNGNFDNYKESFKKINTFYGYLKSKRNPKSEEKPLLFQYMCQKNIGWEKKWLKQNFPKIIYGTHTPINCEDTKEYRYIRALLGLAEHNEYYPNGKENKLQIKIESVEKETKDNKPKYQRLKSPITFKVFDKNIYLLQNNDYEEILDKSFNFTLNKETKSLKVPSEFNLNDLLEFVEQKKIIQRLSR